MNLKLNKLENWFQEKIKLIELYFNNKHAKTLLCNMGDVYFAKIGINIGDEVDKHRPVLVFQSNDWYVKSSGVVFVFPITTNVNKVKYRVFFDENDVSGPIKNGAILIQQGKTISKFRLIYKIGKMRQVKLKEVKQEFENLLYKNTPLQKTEGGKHES